MSQTPFTTHPDYLALPEHKRKMGITEDDFEWYLRSHKKGRYSVGLNEMTRIHKLPQDIIDRIVWVKTRLEWETKYHPSDRSHSWNTWTVLSSSNRDVEVLKWAIDNGCPWHPATTLELAVMGDLDVLQWAVQNGCPWHERTTVFIAEFADTPMMKWALENGCPMCDLLEDHVQCTSMLEFLESYNGGGA